MAVKFSYGKQEKLKSSKDIATLFTHGKNLYSYPVKVFYNVHEDVLHDKFLVKAGVGVSKKYLKSSVLRNRAKRLLREAYRLNKHIITGLNPPCGKSLQLFLLYTAKEILSREIIEEKMIILLNTIKKGISDKSS